MPKTGDTLIDFLHVSLLSTRSGCVECSAGKIWINYGNVIHAEANGLTGEEAFWKIAELDTGNRDFQIGVRTPSRSINRPTELLLIEAQSKSKLLSQNTPPAAPPQQENTPGRVRKTTSILFEIEDEKAPSKKVHLLEYGAIVLGRSNSADIIINDATVSRQHIQLQVGPDQVILSNLSSGNGTYLNGELIEGAVPLKENDVIQIGISVLRFYYVQEGKAALIQEYDENEEERTGVIPH
ncbi:MAG: FHA domain-containing protein [Verrucomicrobiota bacterium]